ncbi:MULTISPECIES: HSP90 family protein [Streptomyces]|uniref:HSP90 family protein n=1 Tax=Streptomyces TaxID=1883 RepID=UPI0003C30A28|nr:MULTISPECIES: HSP90 family protein [unclassified Streptomyces]WDV30483.1 HSP90 family protein [Streptomyces sp. AD16]ESQ01235.1 heat shock protein 90 [Streptomyces sp. GBA 94-10 4N24]ESQ07603.1 heat shock protein 90 [Streptomyces sp. PVA_94-07]RPK61572.1 Chaperone protein HtpG [Streptomyces sp. ADI96-15]UZN57286.1 heat shock protein 90 [Streptomyces sp. GBA 94-10 4N24]
MLHSESSHSFQVDLRGLVDLLSHHLYSSPRVYLRELLQNAVDALTARQAADPGAPAAITVRTGETLTVTDTGIGLTEADVHRFLATIGRSSKRSADGGLDGAGLESARGEFIGQFGIGLLACFVVADEITVVSRHAADPGAPTVEWRGHSDGRYTIRTLPASAMPEPGTTVRLTPRADNAEWTTPERVTELARHFGGLLKYEVTVVDPRGTATRVNDTPPWERPHGSPLARREALTAYCRTTFDFTPLDTIELDLPAAGLRGVAYVLPTAVSPAQRAGHRVHLKGMLLTDKAPELLPDWAFFVRCVVDTTSLRPTASREALYEDGTLAAVRDALGQRIRDWLTGLAASDPALLHRFIDTHHLAVKALARYDDELLRTVLPWLPFETTDGNVTLEEFARNHPTVLVTRSVEEFRQVAPIASAAGLGVVNGGYTYDRDLVHRLPEIRPGSSVTDLDPATVTAHLDAVDPSAELRAAAFLALARETVGAHDCDVVLRDFQPVTAPALLLDNREARHERTRSSLASESDGLWADILGSLRDETPRAQLVLNHLNPLVRQALTITERGLATTAAEALYGQALLLSRRPLRASESALLNRAFIGLLTHAMHPAGPAEPRKDA